MDQAAYRPFIATSADGTRLAAQESGAPDGLELILIHGFNQSHLSWSRQVHDPALASHCRIVTFDMRGHGASDKPADSAFYRDDRRWADDLAGVIAASGMMRPVLVGWSYAGRLITDYLAAYGQNAVAGVNFVGAMLKTDRATMGPGAGHFRAMMNDDLATQIAATRAFLAACFSHGPQGADYETLLAYNMVASPAIRRNIFARNPYDGALLRELSLPVLITHGREDQIILPAMAEFGASQMPHARLSFYDGIGHAPHVEAAARFNAELLAFARQCQTAPLGAA